MKATWLLADGREMTLEVPAGRNLMEVAQAAGVPGIIGECGGTMSCATCHVQVDEAWRGLVGGPSDFEDAMLDTVDAPRTDASRLSCQIEMRADLDGVVVRVPA